MTARRWRWKCTTWIWRTKKTMGLENARVENDGQKLRDLENAGLENDGQTFSKMWAQLRGLENAGLENILDIVSALQDIRITNATDGSHSRQLQQLLAYVKLQWFDRRSVGPDRLCVRDNRALTNNILESYHSGLHPRIQVSHPNFFNFLTHLQNVTVDNMADFTCCRPRRRGISCCCGWRSWTAGLLLLLLLPYAPTFGLRYRGKVQLDS